MTLNLGDNNSFVSLSCFCLMVMRIRAFKIISIGLEDLRFYSILTIFCLTILSISLKAFSRWHLKTRGVEDDCQHFR